MADLPEYVYLIETPVEWPVSVVAGDHPSTPEWVAKKVAERRESRNIGRDGTVRVWRAKLTDVTEMELQPQRVIELTLAPKVEPIQRTGHVAPCPRCRQPIPSAVRHNCRSDAEAG